MTNTRALILGHFSTVGDTTCLDYVKRVLDQAALDYDIAVFSDKARPAIAGALVPAAAKPARYTHLIVVCGPCFPDLFRRAKFNPEQWRHAVRIGVNLTMIEPLSRWNPFDVLIERDSERASRPDLAFLGRDELVPVLGRCVIKSQKEYGARARHDRSLALIEDLVAATKYPVIEIDTRWPIESNRTGLHSPAAVGALMSRLDVLVTNRLHGLVFALRQGVPVLALDAIAGRDKLTAQARVIGWPCCLNVDDADGETMREALAWCLTVDAKEKAVEARDRARNLLSGINDDLTAALKEAPTMTVSGPLPSSPSNGVLSRWLKRRN